MSRQKKKERNEQYRHTLNLPETSFPMRAHLAENEVKWLEKQKQDHFWDRLCEKMSTSPSFILHDGPPYANGAIHIGHAVNKILKDMIIRYKIQSGFRAVLIPGWDCHGMPIEIHIEKEKGRSLSTEELFSASRHYALKQIEQQKKDFIRLGVLADWEHPYLTMDPRVEAEEVRLIASFYKKGLMKRGLKPVHWCLDCCSALAEAEVEYEKKESSSIDVLFPVETLSPSLRAQKSLTEDKLFLVIWTTTPWTLPANQAICVHPDMIYIVVQTPRGLLVVAQDLLDSLAERCSWETNELTVMARFSGSDWVGTTAFRPFDNQVVPVLSGEHVTADSGTGLVHTAPAHGVPDYGVCVNHGIIVRNLIQDDGVFYSSVPVVGGVSVRDADSLVISFLKDNNRLLSFHTLTHSYPHCWRHRTPTIFRATPQWFISLDGVLEGSHDTIRSRAIQQIEHIQFFPERGRERLMSMISSRPDWCLSRQRRWGVPLPFFLHRETGEPHPRTEEFIDRLFPLIEQKGIEAWVSLDICEWLGEDAVFYEKSKDTVDVWFDSGVTHNTVLRGSHHAVLRYPADVYLEGSDQHRGWFHSSLLTGCALDGQAPYRQLITHGFVVDEHGYKMSKSRGNVIAPQEIVSKRGSDVLRLWVASADYTRELSLSDAVLEGVVDIYRRVRNTLRFLLANTSDCHWGKDSLPVDQLLEVDRYMLVYLGHWQNKVKGWYEAYDFPSVVRSLYQFCSEDLGSFYIDILKDRLYTCAVSSLPRRSAQTVLHYMIHALLSCCAPILCFTTDEAWQHLTGDFSDYWLLHSPVQVPSVPHSSELESVWTLIRRLRADVLKAVECEREKTVFGTSWEMALSLGVLPHEQTLLLKRVSELRFIFMVSSVSLHVSESPLPDIRLSSAEGKKCLRCWHVRDDIVSSTDFLGVCQRCFDNISGQGEVRYYA